MPEDERYLLLHKEHNSSYAGYVGKNNGAWSRLWPYSIALNVAVLMMFLVTMILVNQQPYIPLMVYC